jgi:endonuclease YncB( thermonuclease family)
MPTPTVHFQLPTNSHSAEPRTLLRNADGDTPYIEQPVRMVSCDTPEKAQYAGGPAVSQPKLDTCRQRLQGGFYNTLPQTLRDYLIGKLGATAAADHIGAGYDASAFFEQSLADRLTKPDGSRRKLGVIPTGEVIDRYGRLLAYIVPWFADTAADPLPPSGDPRRLTFNLTMIDSGWAAFFPVYKSLPKDADMNLAIAAAESAWDNKRGIWEEYGVNVLLAYEYRMCIKLGTAGTATDGIAQAFQRVCVDLRKLKNVGLFGFADVPPPYRLWVWNDDIAEATSALGLT